MNLSRAAGGCIASLVLLSPCAASPSPREAAVDAVIQEFVQPDAPGLALGIYQGGKLVYAEGYGIADMEANVRITPRTVFHVASVSKQFTAFAIGLLAREGKVDLDADVRKYLPYVPDFGQTITVRDLIQHTSGLRDQWMLFVLAGLDTSNVLRQQHIISMVQRQRALNQAPGTEYGYTNTGYTLLAEIVRAVSGKSLRAFTSERIFQPLGMTQTFFYDDVTEIVPGRAHSYSKRNGRWARALLNFDNVGATSLFTTVEDLAKWAGNFAHPKVGDVQLIEQMRTPGTLRDGTRINYGYALHHATFAGHEALMHYGSDAGYRAAFVYFPKRDFAVMMTANTPPPDQQRAIERIVDIYLNDGAGKLSEAPTEIKPDTATLAAAAGTYQSRYGLTVTLERRGDALVHRTAFNEMPLTFRADGTFELSPRNWTYHRPFRLIRDEHGRVTAFSATEPLVGTVELYSRITPIQPTQQMLAELAGDYRSPELDVTYTLTVEDGALVARAMRIADPMVLSPSIPDRFSTRMATLDFIRNDAGKPTGFRLHSTRVNDILFQRTSP